MEFAIRSYRAAQGGESADALQTILELWLKMKETADYGARLKALKEEQLRLERKQSELLEKRRDEIGRLAERLGVLEADDDTLAGALLELKDALSKTGDERLARWRAAGASFRRKDKDRKAAPPRADAGVAESNPDASRR